MEIRTIGGNMSKNTYNVLDVARHIINHVNENERTISNLKLQKLLYIIQGCFLSCLDKPCFSEPICAWACGPIVLDVHNEFKRFANNSIPTVCTIYDAGENFGLPISKPYEDAIVDSEDLWYIDTIVDTIGLLSMTILGDIIFLQEPWKNAYKSTSKIIDEEELKKYFDTLSK